ncbi:MAG: hypothetical protein GEV05_08100 [Betaproteobacteria bacterium]|nr:hypothetical protein [Betaproteobacteria bacterium]
MIMPARADRQLVLKPQDLYVLLALAASRDQGTTYPELSGFAGLSMSEVHAAFKRAVTARLLFFEEKRPRILLPAFKEFLYHGAKYAFPPVRGGMVGGVPTAHAAPPLNAHIVPSADPAPVWPSAEGRVRGITLVPLYPSAPAAAQRSPAFYEQLALFDAIRTGNARERALARQMFEERL